MLELDPIIDEAWLSIALIELERSAMAALMDSVGAAAVDGDAAAVDGDAVT
jgi:hypothetical protein